MTAHTSSPWPLKTIPNLTHHLLYSLKTIYLFTASDHLTFVLPETFFGILGALAGSTLNDSPPASPRLDSLLLDRLPPVLLWTWLNTFVFTLANQCSPASLKEDSLNKPWRPLPSGRITLAQTRLLLLASIPLVLAICYTRLGGFEETAVLFSLTWMYNSLGGADEDWVVRNLLIASAYAFYGGGALRVAIGRAQVGDAAGLAPRAKLWAALVAAVIFTTIPVQDLKDREGDAARGRRTAVTVMGDRVTRWALAGMIVVWSVVCPGLWGVGWGSAAVCVGMGVYTALRLLLLRGREADRVSWKVWSVWLMGLYALPVCGGS